MRLSIASLMILAAASAFGASGFPSGTYTSGDYSLTFADHGKLELKDKNDVVVNGTWSSDSTKVTVTDESGSYACSTPSATGVYGWKADGDTVTFTKQTDGCDDRAQALDGQKWKRKS
jgi:hypothetical protein